MTVGRSGSVEDWMADGLGIGAEHRPLALVLATPLLAIVGALAISGVLIAIALWLVVRPTADARSAR